MRQIWCIATKELRSYFNSAIALLFLATFLGVALFSVFWIETFFARNTADVRPLFDTLPLLLIFLVAALTMRLWSDEQKTGTLEILLTLPVPVRRLVLGKFLAGLILITIALALTLGFPITVSMMGDLDWGPVFGGYLGALLLAAAYLSIGLTVSAATDNQVVSLIATIAIGLIVYLPGTETVAGYFPTGTADVLRQIGTGSRYESIARGVLDLRDLVYYASFCTVFLCINVVLLHAKCWSAGPKWRRTRQSAVVMAVLVAANAVAFNVWMRPLSATRVDLTEAKAYSLSSATETLMGALDERLVLRAYLSEDMHPLLAPLVPQLRDTLDEYRVAGGSRVEVAVVDPTGDEELETESYKEYNIRRTDPIGFGDRHGGDSKNIYFHVLVVYGDQHVVLGPEDLIQVKMHSLKDIEAQLKNIEYGITKSIRKAVYGFQSTESLLASIPDKVELQAFVTPDTLPEGLKEFPDLLRKVAKEIEESSDGKFSFAEEVPAGEQRSVEIAEQFGIRPALSASLDVMYAHVVVTVGNRRAVLTAPDKPSETKIRDLIQSAIKRVAPGFTKVVGLVEPPPVTPRLPEQMPPQMIEQFKRQFPDRPALSFQSLRRALGGAYEVRSVNLSSGVIPDNIDVLILAGPENIDDAGAKAIDQYFMSGGALVVFAGHSRPAYDPIARGSISVEQVDSGIGHLLDAYGVRVGNTMVLSPKNAKFPVPVTRNVRGLQVRETREVDYPLFVKMESDEFGSSVITAGVDPMVLEFASPVAETASADKGGGIKVTRLMSSSPGSWLQAGTEVSPDYQKYPDSGFGKPEGLSGADQGPQLLAVALNGTFRSAYAAVDDAAGNKSGDNLVERSPNDGRLVVVGSSGFASDQLLGLVAAARSNDTIPRNTLTFVANMVDWAVADTSLLSIRTRGGKTRTLKVAPKSRVRWEIANYIIALAALLMVAGGAWLSRRRMNRVVKQVFQTTSDKGGDQ